jgi:hypothetical protein
MDEPEPAVPGEGQGLDAELHTAKAALDDADAQLRGAAEARRAAADELDRVLVRMRQLYESERTRLQETIRVSEVALRDVEGKLRELDAGSASGDAAPRGPGSEAAANDEDPESDWREFLREQHLS